MFGVTAYVFEFLDFREKNKQNNNNNNFQTPYVTKQGQSNTQFRIESGSHLNYAFDSPCFFTHEIQKYISLKLIYHIIYYYTK